MNKLQILQKFFKCRESAYITWNPSKQSYQKIQKPLTGDVLASHLNGGLPLVAYAITEDNLCYFGAFDIDRDDEQGRQVTVNLKRVLEHFQIPALIEHSGGKGYHLWTLFAPVPSYKAHMLLIRLYNYVREETPVPIEEVPVEIFPKQPRITNEAPFGNAIKLPWGKHPKTHRRTFFLNENFQPHGNQEELFTNIKPLHEEKIDEILNEIGYPKETQERTQDKPLGHETQEIVDMLSNPLREGSRRPTLVKLAGYLRYRGIPKEVALRLLVPWAREAFQDPLPDEEIRKHIEGIYNRYGVNEKNNRKSQPRGGIPKSCLPPQMFKT